MFFPGAFDWFRWQCCTSGQPASRCSWKAGLRGGDRREFLIQCLRVCADILLDMLTVIRDASSTTDYCTANSLNWCDVPTIDQRRNIGNEFCGLSVRHPKWFLHRYLRNGISLSNQMKLSGPKKIWRRILSTIMYSRICCMTLGFRSIGSRKNTGFQIQFLRPNRISDPLG